MGKKTSIDPQKNLFLHNDTLNQIPWLKNQ
jgi:hypothetical protein